MDFLWFYFFWALLILRLVIGWSTSHFGPHSALAVTSGVSSTISRHALWQTVFGQFSLHLSASSPVHAASHAYSGVCSSVPSLLSLFLAMSAESKRVINWNFIEINY